jgi:hypothetical protein
MEWSEEMRTYGMEGLRRNRERKSREVPRRCLSPLYNWTSTMNFGSSPRKNPSSGGGNPLGTRNKTRIRRAMDSFIEMMVITYMDKTTIV